MREAIEKAIGYLANHKGYKIIDFTKPPDGSLTFPHYIYDEEVYDLIHLINSGIRDDNYNGFAGDIQNVKNIPINEMSMGNVKTYLTFIVRTERFCGGLIAEHINNGILVELLSRFIKLH